MYDLSYHEITFCDSCTGNPDAMLTAWPIIFCCPLILDHSEEMILELLDCHCGVPCNVHYTEILLL